MTEATDSGRQAQAEQADLVDRARAIPGVADVIDVYGKLTRYMRATEWAQPAQMRNATGGNLTAQRS